MDYPSYRMILNGVDRLTERIGDAVEQLSEAVEPAIESVVEFAKGIGDMAVDLYHFPDDVARYVTGTDNHLGERRSWSRFGTSFSTHSRDLNVKSVRRSKAISMPSLPFTIWPLICQARWREPNINWQDSIRQKSQMN